MPRSDRDGHVPESILQTMRGMEEEQRQGDAFAGFGPGSKFKSEWCSKYFSDILLFVLPRMEVMLLLLLMLSMMKVSDCMVYIIYTINFHLYHVENNLSNTA